MSKSEHFRLGTRGSLLARVQTDWVMARLKEACPDVIFEVTVIRTSGDVASAQASAARRFLGKGMFTREIESALLNEEIDLAVHSLKDLPAEWPDGLALGAVPPREDPRDALVGCPMERLAQATPPVTVGTSSLRRRAQLRQQFPHCRVVDLRGNVDTRLRKIADGEATGAVLAAAGLRRAGYGRDIVAYFSPDIMLPAPGQGALAVEIRADDPRTRQLVSHLHCPETAARVQAERAFMHRLGGGCHVPVAALASLNREALRLRGRVVSLDGMHCVEGQREGRAEHAAAIGEMLAVHLLSQGAEKILSEAAAGDGQQ